MKSLIIVSTLLISGCSAMSVQQCETANWVTVGEKDGSEGKSSRLAEYDKSCQSANIIPNRNQYNMGYARGQEVYCQPNTVFYKALNGEGDFRVCPLYKQTQIQPYFEVASRYYHANKEYTSYEDDYNRYLNYVLDSKTKPKDREYYKHQLEDLQNRKFSIETNYHDATRDLERFKYQHNL